MKATPQTTGSSPATIARRFRPDQIACLVCAATLLAALVALSGMTRSRNIGFLPKLGAGDWIVYPLEPSVALQPTIELQTTFRFIFELKSPPSSAQLKAAGYRRFVVAVNGRPVEPVASSLNWKKPYTYDLARSLQRGTNQLSVTVFNSSGPPALWLALEADDFRLGTSENREASCAGATWRKARLASKAVEPASGNPLSEAETPAQAIRASWKIILVFLLIIGGVAFGLQRAPGFPWFDSVLPLVFAAIWVALFINNLGVLPFNDGFDEGGHRDYINYIQTHKSLPLANEGWEMFQPPLYYLLCAGWLGIFSLTTRTPEGVLAVRCLGLIIGVAHFVLVWASLRLLFPQGKWIARLGLVLAASLAPLLYLSQFVTNEGLAACLITASVYVCLRMLKQERWTIPACGWLGLLLGAALLAKATALVVILPISMALLWRAMTRRAEVGNTSSRLTEATSRIGLVALVSLFVCGWHYFRVWNHFGNPLLGNWDPRIAPPWWQQDGYRTLPFYLRFGAVLNHPWYSGLHSFWDGIFSTLWGDGLLAGAGEFLQGPPWNYALMAIGFWLAMIPTTAIITGLVLGLLHFFRSPSPDWLLILGLGFFAVLAIIYNSLTVPTYSSVKAFYGLGALLPLCALGGWGVWFWMGNNATRRLVVCGSVGLWAFNSFASFWIVHSSPETTLARARQLAAIGNAAEAREILNKGLERSGENTRLRAALVANLLAAGETEQAGEQAGRALQESPQTGRLHDLLGMALARQRQVQPAASEFRKAIELAPGEGAAYRHLAALLLYENHIDEVEGISRDGLAVDPYDAELRSSLASALAVKSDWEGAAAQLQLACRLEPASPRFHCRLAAALERMQRTAEAAEEYTQTLRLQPRFPEAMLNLAWIRATNPAESLRNAIDAVRLAEAACDAAQYRDPECLATLAAAYAEAGRFVEAETAAKKAKSLALTPGQTNRIPFYEDLAARFAAKKPWREQPNHKPRHID